MKRNNRKEKKSHYWIFLVIMLFIVVILLAGTFAVRYLEEQSKKIIRQVTIETGSQILLTDFFTEEPFEGSHFVTDVSMIDTNIPMSYELTIKAWKFDVKCLLIIEDSIAPVGAAVPQTVYTNNVPDARDCISGEYDLSGVVSIDYYGDPMEFVATSGEKLIPVSLTDAYGNQTVIHVPFTVIDDHSAPLIFGPHDMHCYIGDPISYRDGIYITDNYDPNPELVIDTSEVHPDYPGIYPIRYIATDENGNVRTTTVYLTLEVKPEGFVDEEIVYALAQEILDNIITDDLTDVEVAFRIFKWTYTNIHYIGTSDKSHWTSGAYEGFTRLQGDCYTYYACNKVLLDLAGIDNMLCERNPVTWGQHFWNLVYLNGQWYHCDSCWSQSHEGYYFMRTEEEVQDGRHVYVTDGYPERASESVQSRLDWYNLTLREE